MGAPTKAGAWLDRMQDEFDVKPTVRTFAHVLDGFSDAGGLAEARDWLARMDEYGVSPDIRCMNALIKVWCKSTNEDPHMEYAEAWFDHACEVMEPDCFSYGNMIYGYDLRGDLDRAWQYFSDMI